MAKRQPNYVQRKVDHMNRMGISAKIVAGAACPDWLADKMEEDAKRAASKR